MCSALLMCSVLLSSQHIEIVWTVQWRHLYTDIQVTLTPFCSLPRGDVSVSYKKPTSAHLYFSHNLLATCYCDMFRPSKCHLQGLRLILVRPSAPRASILSGNSNMRNKKRKTFIQGWLHFFTCSAGNRQIAAARWGLATKHLLTCVQRALRAGGTQVCVLTFRWQSGNCWSN